MLTRKRYSLKASQPAPDLLPLGLACTLRDYQLGFLLNQLLHLDLERQPDFEVEIPRTRQRLNFCWFRYTDPELHLTYHLLSNRCGQNCLLPEYRQADYLLCVSGAESNLLRDLLFERLRSRAELQLVFEIDLRRVKHQNRLIFD
ncbi:MAG: IPExxxVDY family protein [Chitinophagales bacterium]|nr:IPExxxVDY family protein [Chitinophagales bacterium]MDW8428654.1 IPExxxVDY family protein [Chitinophagales bacterium]